VSKDFKVDSRLGVDLVSLMIDFVKTI